MYVRQLETLQPVEWDVETDVLVVGGGGTGLTAAVAASEDNVSVTLIEKNDELGGNTALSSAIIPGAVTNLQREADIEDSPERLAEDVLAKNGHTDEELVRTIAAASGPTIDWLVKKVGVNFQLNTGPYGVPGHSVDRIHFPVEDDGTISRTGEPLIDTLRETADERGVDIRTGMGVQQLIVDDGAVVGAATEGTALTPGRLKRSLIRAEKTLIATDGFGANPDMREQYIPETLDMDYWGTPGNTGEAIKWGERLGAVVSNVTYFCYPTFTDPDGVYMPEELIREGAIIVNGDGERFMDAGDVPYLAITDGIREQPGGIAYEVFDQRAYDALSSSPYTCEKFANPVEEGVLSSGETARDLAAALGVDPDCLAETINAVNHVVEGGGDADGIGRAVEKTLEPPLYGTKVKPQVNEGVGGVRIDTSARVLDSDGDPIPNLFAGGGACAGIHGGDPAGYIPGTQLMTVLTLGREMGRTAVEELATD